MVKQDEFFVGLLKPKKLDGADVNNIIYKARKEFENLCIAISNSGMTEKPEKMTVMRFFSTLQYFEKKKTKQSPSNQRKK